jgi:hypothetical protein
VAFAAAKGRNKCRHGRAPLAPNGFWGGYG